jgi:hypothetical protein
MIISSAKARPDHLPVTQSLNFAYICSLIIALLVAIVSIAGVFFHTTVYPTEDLFQNFVTTDVLHLFFGLPILLGAMWFARRGSLIGLLFWPGALFFFIYDYTVSVVVMPTNIAYPVYLTLLTLCIYTLAGLLASTDSGAIKARLSGKFSEKLSGGLLAALGILFVARTLGVLGGAIMDATTLPITEQGLLIADFLNSAAMTIVGVLLWRRKAFGYVGGAGLLFQASMLFIGLVFLFILQPFLTSAPFAAADALFVFVMGLPCFVVFGLFIRGVISSSIS